MSKSRVALLVLLGGIIGAALDLFYAFAFYGYHGLSAVRILQSIAGGLLGAESYRGGASTAALGLLLHLLIAMAAAGVFYAVSRKFSFLHEHWVASGIAFGLCIYGFMNFVVIPLSAFPHKPAYPWPALASGVFVHAFFVGLPISACVRVASGTPRMFADRLLGVLRSVLAVLAGYMIFALSAFAFFRVSGQPPHQAAPLPIMLGSVAIGMLFASLGGYVAGWLAMCRPFAHGLAVAALLSLGAAISLFSTFGRGAIWSQVAALTFMAPCAVLGGWLRSRQLAGVSLPS